MQTQVCTEECSRPATRSCGLCESHYRRSLQKRPPEARNLSTEDKFWAHVAKSDGCWEWTGAKSWNGYGQFRTHIKKMHYAHRFAYEQIVGPIPDGLQLDHLCMNRGCVNPEHLEPVTRQENIRRSGIVAGREAWLSSITHCPDGHEYTEANTHVDPKSGSRSCRECARTRARATYRALHSLS